MSAHSIFGTDGIRGRAGEGWLALDKVTRLGWALGEVLGKGPAQTGAARPVLLGHDGRRSGPELVDALAHGLSGAGFQPVSTGLITTPGLAYLTLAGDFQLGAMVSASHNPAEDNGIKVFSSAGEKLSDDLQDQIERLLQSPPAELPTGAGPSTATELEEDYLAHLLRHASGLSLDGVVIALDCANGGGSRVAPRVFGRLGAQVASMASEPDGENINDGCGSTYPERLIEEVRSRAARIGIALDGDGDRCILVDENGKIVHGDGIMTVLARHAAAKGHYKDPRIVATVMSNRGLHRALREVGVGVVEVGVGDRQVVEGLRNESLQLGGEQSGHIILGEENHYIGDGVLTALHVLRVMQESGKSLSSLVAPYQPMPQVLLNVQVTEKPNLANIPEIVDLVRSVEKQLGDDGRVLLRYSGTEPLARVMVEGTDLDFINARAREIADSIERQIGVAS
ncbi:MAG: phosphoglucosamine mutase [Chlamydiales bacterium]